ncbi:CPBP family intramembrane glutamic endopeptidase [Pantoea phytobeneficialis]|uniref:CPBP family intramembrane metalloprotease n=1 Tax=Pantoea phytobeneficialis TaxID=2052056 RepID=A0AAP9H9Z4_9GAMM|nr:CPBP family intramembrane glutamic endopeptidase [Pantoea phytobeneficialis]MDO6407424.1 CPBP family intramembrane metalloprotease [Pantoea phytobeneficialis]QGR09530.1 CPBP family intramembrane metalloprotease domain-containing protein [Pantoea phytobeneficialis]
MWILLAIALLFLETHKKFALGILLITVILATYTHVLDWQAWLFFAGLLLVALTSFRFGENKLVRYGAEVLMLIAAIALMTHQLPGFHNVKVLDQVIAGPQSVPFTMYYNFDKALTPFVLLVVMRSLFVSQPSRQALRWQWLGLVLSVPALLWLAVYFGGLKPERHLPQWLIQFAFANVFFVSLAEEALFRGYLQQRLAGWISPFLALVLAALLFGLMHITGGILLVVFASLAGLIYGLAWMWSGRLWVAVLFHVALNMLHLLFFTYPMLRH